MLEPAVVEVVRPLLILLADHIRIPHKDLLCTEANDVRQLTSFRSFERVDVVDLYPHKTSANEAAA
jgi:hypothetical protein